MPKSVVYDKAYIKSRVTITSSDCWEWNGHCDKDGYGQANSRLGTNSRAHRLSYEIFKGSTKGLVIRHTCDNPPCCNPDHLIEGTHRNNLNDAVERGRRDLKAASEHANSFIKIPPEKAEAILKYHHEHGGTQSEIAQAFGVSQKTISNILHSKHYTQET